MLDFLSQPNNLMWAFMFVASGILLAMPDLKKLGGATELSTLDATRLINSGATILDVRDPTEFATGRLPKSKHIPVGELPNRLAELEKLKDKPILLVCGNGMRSPKAARILKQAQFTSIAQLKGGLGEWLKAGLPLEK